MRKIVTCPCGSKNLAKFNATKKYKFRKGKAVERARSTILSSKWIKCRVCHDKFIANP